MSISAQVSRVEVGVEQASTMLKEIHEWFLENLKNGTPARDYQATTTTIPQAETTPLRDVTFELYLNASTGQTPTLICDQVSLSSSYSIKTSEDTQTKVFECRCNTTDQERRKGPHADTVAAYASESANYMLILPKRSRLMKASTVSRGTFPVRVAGKERSWLIYRATDTDTNRVVSLTVKGVSLHGMSTSKPRSGYHLASTIHSSRSGMVDFEQAFIQRLADAQAAVMFHRGENNMLAYVDPDKQEGRRLHLVA